MKNKIEILKSAIDKFSPYVAAGDRRAVAEQLPELAKVMGEVLPEIIALYDDEKMAAYKDDQLYWGEQLSRILGALEQGDMFLAYDALVHELKANLIELQKVIEM